MFLSWNGCAMGASRWCGVLLSLWLAPVAWAGQYVLVAGQANTVPVSARVLNGEQVCNLEITVPGQPPFERVVRAPFFDTRIAITPGNEATVLVQWRGLSRRTADGVVNACPTQGDLAFNVVRDNALTRAVWSAMLAQLSPAKAECVRVGMTHEKVRPEWFDFNDARPSAEDLRIQRVFSQCDAFLARPKAWGAQSPAGHACTLAGGIQTRCEGFFSAQVNGKTQVITQEVAIQMQMSNQPWSTGVREIAGAKNKRAQLEKERVVRLEAEEAARVQAIEDERLLAEKQAAEAKLAEQRAIQAKIDALKAQIAEDKIRKEKERIENRNWLLKQVDKMTGKNQPVPTEEAKPTQPAGAAEPAVAPSAAPAVAPVAAPVSAPVSAPAPASAPASAPAPAPAAGPAK
jgi:hypothetical protein